MTGDTVLGLDHPDDKPCLFTSYEARSETLPGRVGRVGPLSTGIGVVLSTAGSLVCNVSIFNA
jgi:hypothetical protein